jgi:hypothetical protein
VPSGGIAGLREATLRVDAVVDPGQGTPGMQIATFVERLRRAGFDPVPLDPQSQNAAATRSAGGFFSDLLRRPAPAIAANATPGTVAVAGATP